MALHDFICPSCGRVAHDQYRPIAIRASHMPVVCGCGYLMVWIPQVGAMDAKEPFQTFTTEVLQRDGSHRTTTIDSLHTLRRLERESEQAYRNGEGQPMRFRMWNQNASNGDVNTFGDDPGTIARRELAKAQAGTVERHGSTAPDIALGPGVQESGMSALGEE